MKQVLVSLNRNDKSIEYSLDLESGQFQTAMSGTGGEKTIVQSGGIGSSDTEKQEIALKMYHVILAALRAP